MRKIEKINLGFLHEVSFYVFDRTCSRVAKYRVPNPSGNHWNRPVPYFLLIPPWTSICKTGRNQDLVCYFEGKHMTLIPVIMRWGKHKNLRMMRREKRRWVSQETTENPPVSGTPDRAGIGTKKGNGCIAKYLPMLAITWYCLSAYINHDIVQGSFIGMSLCLHSVLVALRPLPPIWKHSMNCLE